MLVLSLVSAEASFPAPNMGGGKAEAAC